MPRPRLLDAAAVLAALWLAGCATPPTTVPAPPANPLAELTRACEAAVADVVRTLPAGTTGAAGAAGAAERPVVAVLPFTDTDGGVRRLGMLAASETERVLLARGFKLVDRQNLAAVLREQDLQSALANAAATQKVAALLHADLLLLGSLADTGPRIALSARVVGAQTGLAIVVSQQHAMPADGLGQLMWYVRRPAAGRPAGELPPLSIRYEFVSPKAGGEVALAAGARVADGQQFKLRVQANSDCCLYVLLYDSQGKASVLFPHREIALGNEVRGGATYEIPEAGKWYWFDRNPGLETFHLVASYTPLTDLDAMLDRVRHAGQQAAIAEAAASARSHIDAVVTRGMKPDTAATYQPKGLTIRPRGVGGVVDLGWGAGRGDGDEAIAAGHATVVKKITFEHRR